MAVIRSFRGLRYQATAGELDLLIAPPYDVLSSKQRDEFAEKSAYNVVHLTLPESRPDDRSRYVQYARSSAALSEWRRESVLKPESLPTIYRYRQNFSVNAASKPITRTTLIALMRLESFESGVVLPHEQTFAKPKEDRLRLLEATRTHLEPVFGLYEDSIGDLARLIDAAPVVGSVSVRADDHVGNELGLIEDVEAQSSIVAALAGKRILIADGHHRYETALAFRASLGERTTEVPEDYILIALTSTSDPGLSLLPTHRIVRKSAIAASEIRDRLSPQFELRPVQAPTLMDEISAVASRGGQAFGLVLADREGYVVVPKDLPEFGAQVQTGDTDPLWRLDVSVLHKVILEECLGIGAQATLEYTQDPKIAIQAVRAGAAMSWLMNPPSISEIEQVALAGERMPHKSTYFYPKIESGLVLWSLKEF